MFSFFKKDNFTVVKLELSDVPRLADLHKKVFSTAWGSDSFTSLLNDERVFGFVTYKVGDPNNIVGFIVARLVCDEAEIITLGVAPKQRRLGVGRLMINRLMQYLHCQRASVLFLEVDEKNTAAIKLYQSCNFRVFGRRSGYYADEQGRSDALMMRRDFK